MSPGLLLCNTGKEEQKKKAQKEHEASHIWTSKKYRPILTCCNYTKDLFRAFSASKISRKRDNKMVQKCKVLLSLWKIRASKYSENIHIHIFPSSLLTCLIFQLSFQLRGSHENEKHISGILSTVYIYFFSFLFSYVKWVIDKHIADNAMFSRWKLLHFKEFFLAMQTYYVDKLL